jgi:hypothetical protein
VSPTIGSSRLELALTNYLTCPWPADAKRICCFGDGFGSQSVALGEGVSVGATAVLNLELTAPDAPTVVA